MKIAFCKHKCPLTHSEPVVSENRAKGHVSVFISLIFENSADAGYYTFSSFSRIRRATKTPLAEAWDREWVTPEPSPMT